MAVILSRKSGGGSGGGAPSGPAGGGLAGTYPNPTVDWSDQELAYAEITANVTVASSNGASPTDVVSSGAFVYTGVRVCIEFYAAVVELGASTQFILCSLWDGATRLGDMTSFSGGVSSAPVSARRYLTPTAASHTYRIRAYRGGADGTIYAAAGGSGQYMPSYIRVTLA